MNTLVKNTLVKNMSIMDINDWSSMVIQAYDELETKKKILSDRLILPVPDYEATPTRVHWKNVKAFLRIINRSPEHWFKWLQKEREVAWYSAKKSDGLVFHGKRQKLSDINELSMKYINNYVICPSCKNHNTTLNKQTDINSWLLSCINCNSTKYVD